MAGSVREKSAVNGAKRERAVDHKAPPAKKAKLLDNTDDEESDGEQGGVSLKVNEEYARRFEYNKKREEQHRLEEKYGKGKAFQEEDDSEDSEEGVEEDDAADLLDEALDDEVNATLQALRSKDPRIYDSEAKFYREIEEDGTTTNGKPKEQSMTLKQYHTKNLLEGKVAGEEDDVPRRTYAQEQEDARQDLVRKANAEEEEDDDFLVAKPKPAKSKQERKKITVEDIEKADQDPETFLSNFMESRAWVPADKTAWKPLESDDDDEDAAADEWEQSYNHYFEETAGSNEKIMTYARDAVANTTVRRDDASGRRKAREMARAKRDAEKREREQDLARLRKLKVDEMEQKVKQIRQIGGLKGRDFNMDEWKDVLEADWSDDQWDVEMQKRFGDAYYDEGDDAAQGSEDESSKKSKKPKKPKFDDDIDIKDLIPDFKDDEEDKPEFTLSDDEDEDAEASADEDAMDVDEPSTSKSSKKRKQERAEAKSSARRDRRLIENLVDENLQYESALASKPKAPTQFRYRETSPTTFGLTARDILLADDKALNEFAGLKKLAAFRDPVKKKKDKKHLSKKARLRQWRQETFGDADGPKGGFETLLAEEEVQRPQKRKAKKEDEDSNIVEGKKKKKRSRKGKGAAAEAA